MVFLDLDISRWTRGVVCALVAVGMMTDGAFAESLKNGEDCAWTTTVTVVRGEEHTFWVTGLSADTAVNSLSVEGEYSYTEDGERYDFIFPSKTKENYDWTGRLTGLYCLLTSDDWEYMPTNVKSVKFTVTVDGFYDAAAPTNSTFTFGHAKGRRSFPPTFVPVALDIVGEGTVTGLGKGVYADGTKLNLRAKPAAGFYFAGWEVDGQTVSTSASFPYTVPDAEDGVCLTARFVFDAIDFEPVGDVACDAGEEIEVPVFCTSGTAVRYKVANLPKGVKFDEKSMTISGTPTVPGVRHEQEQKRRHVDVQDLRRELPRRLVRRR